MSDLKEIRALAFDVFGTSVDWRSAVVREARALGQRKGLEADWEAFAEAWRAEYQPALAEVREGRRRFVKLDRLHREMLEKVLPRFGLQTLSEGERAELTRVWRRLDAWPDAVEGVGRLKRRFIVAAVSNGDIALMVHLARHTGLPWDAILGAELAQTYKPQPEVYLTAAALLDLKPKHVLMVAAHEDDLAGASECGLRTAYVHRPAEHGPAGPPASLPRRRFDLHVESFAELAERLGA